MEQLIKQVKELEDQLNVGWQAYETLQQQSCSQLMQYGEKVQDLQQQLTAVSSEKSKVIKVTKYPVKWIFFVFFVI